MTTDPVAELIARGLATLCGEYLDAPVPPGYYTDTAGLVAAVRDAIRAEERERVLPALDAAWVMCVEQQHHRAPGWSMAKSWAWDKLRAALDALPLDVRLTFDPDAEPVRAAQGEPQ